MTGRWRFLRSLQVQVVRATLRPRFVCRGWTTRLWTALLRLGPGRWVVRRFVRRRRRLHNRLGPLERLPRVLLPYLLRELLRRSPVLRVLRPVLPVLLRRLSRPSRPRLDRPRARYVPIRTARALPRLRVPHNPDQWLNRRRSLDNRAPVCVQRVLCSLRRRNPVQEQPARCRQRCSCGPGAPGPAWRPP
jgi:hypothetical protein